MARPLPWCLRRGTLDWNSTLEVAQAVDCSGMEAILPVGRWRGYGGPSDFNGAAYESFTWASALGASTRYVTVLATCHVPLVHPLMVAKMSSTIDHVTNGRFALNIVCGWFKNEFDMFGALLRPHDDRYKFATEWLDFLKQAWTARRICPFASCFSKSFRRTGQVRQSSHLNHNAL